MYIYIHIVCAHCVCAHCVCARNVCVCVILYIVMDQVANALNDTSSEETPAEGNQP